MAEGAIPVDDDDDDDEAVGQEGGGIIVALVLAEIASATASSDLVP